MASTHPSHTCRPPDCPGMHTPDKPPCPVVPFRLRRLWAALGAVTVTVGLGACTVTSKPSEPAHPKPVVSRADKVTNVVGTGTNLFRFEVDGVPCILAESDVYAGDAIALSCDWAYLDGNRLPKERG